MKVRRSDDVRMREDPGFGGIVYVHHRNDFFAATYEIYKAIKDLSQEYRESALDWNDTYSALAKLGICETTDPVIEEEAYSGPSFLGIFQEIPSVEKPLVVNCFTTAYCPLNCIYCHAYDLMQDYRNTESEFDTNKGQADIKNVISTATMIPAMVAVLTGGDPLSRPQRTVQLIEGLSRQKSLVLDTSGYGEIDKLLPILKEYDVHVRVSLDSLSNENDQWRILNPHYKKNSYSSSPRENSINTIKKCIRSGIGLTVQTVVHSKNDKLDQLIDLRDGLIELGVKNWVLHVAIRGGLARKKERALERSRQRSGSILPGDYVRTDLWKMMELSMKDKKTIDIRCTDNDSTPNSVLLINSEGDLFTEGMAHNGKVKLYDVKKNRPEQFRAMWSNIDWLGHSRRYFNWNKWYFNQQNLEDNCYQVPYPSDDAYGLSNPERKYEVRNKDLLIELLAQENFLLISELVQRDEYYDTKKSNLNSFDYILRIRKEKELGSLCESISLNFIGPRFYAETGEYSHFELGFSVSDQVELCNELKNMRLELIWYFEKKRASYACNNYSLRIALDEVPELGNYLELKGPPEEINSLEKVFLETLGAAETRNYRDIYIENMQSKGIHVYGTEGPTFKKK